MFHTALAAFQGPSAIEEKSLDLLDRLERKGFARRVRHPKDGRSVLVEAVPDRTAALSRFSMTGYGRSASCARNTPTMSWRPSSIS